MDILSYQASKKAQERIQQLRERIGVDGAEQGAPADNVDGIDKTVKERLSALEDKREGLRNQTIVFDTDSDWNSGTHVDTKSKNGRLGAYKKLQDQVITVSDTTNVSTNSEPNSSHPAWHVFDDDPETYYHEDSLDYGAAERATITYKFNDKQIIQKFSVTAPKNVYVYDITPRSYIIYGSNDNTNWDELAYITGQANYDYNEKRIFDLETTGEYQYYKISFGHSDDWSQIAVGEVEFLVEEIGGYGTWESPVHDLGEDLISLNSIDLAGTGLSNANVFTKTENDTDYIALNTDGTIASNFGKTLQIKVELTDGTTPPEIDKLVVNYQTKPLVNRVGELEEKTAINLNKHNLHMNTVLNKNRFGLTDLVFDDFGDDTGIDASKSFGHAFDASNKKVIIDEVNGATQAEVVTTPETTDTVPQMITISQATNEKTNDIKSIDLANGTHTNTVNNNGYIELNVAGTIEFGYTNNIIPTLSSNSSASPIVVSSSSNYTGEEAWKAFDNNSSTSWVPISTNDEWIQIDLGENKIIKKYTITGHVNDPMRSPKDWMLLASDTGDFTGEEAALDIQLSISWNAGETKSFEIANYNSYRYYRIHINANNGASYLNVSQIELMESAIQNLYHSSGIYESPVLDLGDNFKEITKIDQIISLPSKYTENLIPMMTSNTSPEGVAFSSPTVSSYFNAYNAFDGVKSAVNYNNIEGWESETNTGYLGYEFSSPVQINKYTLNAYNVEKGDVRMPKDWTFEAWNGYEWIVLDERTNETNWGLGETRDYTFENIQEYNKYRINVTANNGHTYLAICEMEMMTVTPGSSDFIIYTSTSSDNIAFSDWLPANADGTLNSPSARYIKIKAELQAGGNTVSNLVHDFTLGERTDFEADDQIIFDGSAKLKTQYNEEMIADANWTESGTLLRKTIDKTAFKSIEKIGVERNESI